MGKTIKQLADEIGVSKQAVQKRLIREPLCTTVQPHIEIINGVKYIDVVGEDLIKTAFLKSKKNDVHMDMGVDENEKSMDEMSVYTPMIEMLQNTIDTLKVQLEVKDRQIEMQQEQIRMLQEELERERQHSREVSDKLTVLADQAQQLHAADKKALLLIEEKENAPKMSFWERQAAKWAERKAKKGE